VNWADERYVRVYTRDTAEWLALRWEAKALLPLLLRKADRAGVIAVKPGPNRARLVAGLVAIPADVVEPAIADLLADGSLVESELGFTFPNYIEAQESPQTNAQRQRESRARRRDLGTQSRHSVTDRDPIASHIVTEHHALSQAVTPSLAVPSRADLFAGDAQVAPPPPARKRRNVVREEVQPTNPRHHPLQLAMESAFREVTGRAYVFQKRDPVALAQLARSDSSDEEIVGLWRIALGRTGYQLPTDIFDFVAKLNLYAMSGSTPPTGGPLFQSDTRAPPNVSQRYGPPHENWPGSGGCPCWDCKPGNRVAHG
jgi:hypothetical protein